MKRTAVGVVLAALIVSTGALAQAPMSAKNIAKNKYRDAVEIGKRADDRVNKAEDAVSTDKAKIRTDKATFNGQSAKDSAKLTRDQKVLNRAVADDPNLKSKRSAPVMPAVQGGSYSGLTLIKK